MSLSRQRLFQKEQQRKGLCIKCPLPRDPNSATHCRIHALDHQRRSREAAGCGKWRSGGQGRPPKVRE